MDDLDSHLPGDDRLGACVGEGSLNTVKGEGGVPAEINSAIVPGTAADQLP